MDEFCPCGAYGPQGRGDWHRPGCEFRSSTPDFSPLQRGFCTHIVSTDGVFHPSKTRAGTPYSGKLKVVHLLRCGCALRDSEAARVLAQHQNRPPPLAPCEWHAPRPCCFNAVAHDCNGRRCYLLCTGHTQAERNQAYGIPNRD